MDKSETGRAPPEACVEHSYHGTLLDFYFYFHTQPTAYGYLGRRLNPRWIVVVRLVKFLILHTQINPESPSILGQLDRPFTGLFPSWLEYHSAWAWHRFSRA